MRINQWTCKQIHLDTSCAMQGIAPYGLTFLFEWCISHSIRQSRLLRSTLDMEVMLIATMASSVISEIASKHSGWSYDMPALLTRMPTSMLATFCFKPYQQEFLVSCPACTRSATKYFVSTIYFLLISSAATFSLSSVRDTRYIFMPERAQNLQNISKNYVYKKVKSQMWRECNATPPFSKADTSKTI